MDVYSKLNEMGLKLPSLPSAAGVYKPVKQVGNLIFLSGQLPLQSEGKYIQGKLGLERTIEEGQEAARLCTLSALSVLDNYLGDLNKIKSVVKLLVFVQSAEDFSDQPQVANGASQLLVDLFGEDKGKGARSAVGCTQLPRNASVEIEYILEI